MATSLNVVYDYTNDIERAVSRVKQAGFDGLDFNGCDQMPIWRGEQGEAYFQRLRAACEREGLPFVQAHGPMYGYWGENAQQGLEDTFRCLDWCGQLNVPWMVMHPAGIPGGYDAAHRERTIAKNVEYFQQFLPTMERLGVGIAIENTADAFGRGRAFGAVPEDLVQLCDTLDHELFGLCWDTGHALLQKLPQDEAIGSLGSRLKVLHIQDNDGVGDDHLLPFHGKIEWPKVIAGLKQAGYQGAWTFETHNAVRILPDELRDEAMRLAVAVGKWFTRQFAK